MGLVDFSNVTWHLVPFKELPKFVEKADIPFDCLRALPLCLAGEPEALNEVSKVQAIVIHFSLHEIRLTPVCKIRLTKSFRQQKIGLLSRPIPLYIVYPG
jgi:hypothetical protein